MSAARDPRFLRGAEQADAYAADGAPLVDGEPVRRDDAGFSETQRQWAAADRFYVDPEEAAAAKKAQKRWRRISDEFRAAVLAIGRLTHYHPSVDSQTYPVDRVFKLPVVPADEANVASSLLTNGRHAPAIDVDLPVHAVPSSTPGHSHLYIDAELTWDDYLRLLTVMAEVGLVEEGFLDSARKRGTTLLRLPGVTKP
ncbi:hypothetical protein [Blastococcus saxobsidens]|uniref:Uncharacterized protein n=1 Tax=Blastococcus saxobsidens TaxID=138336 RepID=A0A4Q7Y1H4_9ACTN|nr:hypothetical protein [Blastococcus saxobsidens]RZU30630.1 hypothetical protein BKA19_0250 [Blastococcus saxobsidens]